MDRYVINKVLVIDDELKSDTVGGQALREIIKALREEGLIVIEALRGSDGCSIIQTQMDVACVLVDWILGEEVLNDMYMGNPEGLIGDISNVRPNVPIFIITDKRTIEKIPPNTLEKVQGYIWKVEDTPVFIVGRIKTAVKEYWKKMLPPFFGKLKEYVESCGYSWHTPGHSGGMAFKKTPVGEVFFNFYGENTMRADLSVSASELGSLLEHTSPIKEAEEQAAKTFGANKTYFVTNGTSTSNKIVFHALVEPEDTILADGNCHKSLLHAIIMSGAEPFYLKPTKNKWGIIGPIPLKTIEKTIEKVKEPKLMVITNSTYDGVIYDVGKIIEITKNKRQIKILFDEAWYAYAKFHPFYKGRLAMDKNNYDENIGLYATQSTHKLLASFSQASMIHIKDKKFEPEKGMDFSPLEIAFNEAFMMHTSTSPQYSIIASLDVATAMMKNHGKRLIHEAIDEAVMFRKKMQEIHKEKNAWFRIWGPEIEKDLLSLEDLSKDNLDDWREQWLLKKWNTGDEEKFNELANDNDESLLDPIKVTVITKDGNDFVIPACVVAKYLRNQGIQVEKTGHYTLLFLFSIGITKGKSGTLISALLNFAKEYFHYDEKNKRLDYGEIKEKRKRLKEINQKLAEMKEVDRGNPEKDERLEKKELKREKMELVKHIGPHPEELDDLSNQFGKLFESFKEERGIPSQAYKEVIKGAFEKVKFKACENKESAFMIAPYPPGIPIIMPGEKIGKEASEYLQAVAKFNRNYPEYATEVHGLPLDKEGKHFYDGIYVLKPEKNGKNSSTSK